MARVVVNQLKRTMTTIVKTLKFVNCLTSQSVNVKSITKFLLCLSLQAKFNVVLVQAPYDRQGKRTLSRIRVYFLAYMVG
jgi:c-di-GMP-related signal transduction protein